MKYILSFFVILHKTRMYLLVTLFSFVTYFLFTFSTSVIFANSLPTFPINSSQIEIINSWTPQEKWVWDCICRGEIADFNKTENYGGNLSPKSPEGWPENRILRSAFIESILFNESLRSSITRNGIFIRGAWFKEILNLSGANLDFPIAIESSRFEEDVYFSFLKTSKPFYLAKNRFLKKLSMSSVQKDNHLLSSH